MRKIVFALAFAGVAFGVEVVETPEETVPIKVSLKDVNRIVCVGGKIEFTAYSKEKRIEVKKEGKNAFVKIVPKIKGGKLVYEKVPRELYVGCVGRTFALLLIPKDIPAKTVYLKPPYEDNKRAREYEKEESYLAYVKKVFGDIYREAIPPGYRVVYPEKREVLEFEELSMSLHRTYEGGRYAVEEYVIVAKKDLSIEEGAFLPYLRKPLAIAITKPRLRKGESARLLVLRKR